MDVREYIKLCCVKRGISPKPSLHGEQGKHRKT